MVPGRLLSALWACVAVAWLAPALVAPAAATQPVVGVTTGINATTGARPVRRNINDLYNEGGPHWDLYVQALDLFQHTDINDVLSYYQITGIHGLPFVPWDGVDQVTGGARSGYCPHGQITFTTWHRPYLALFEQVLAGHVATVADQYPPDIVDEYRAAADTFRIPFWDWAAGDAAVSAAMPSAVAAPTVTIRGPTGPVSVRNPLYSFTFPQFPFPSGQGWGGSLVQFNETKRCTVVATGPGNGVSDASLTDSILGGHGGLLQDKVYAVFTQDNSFEAMATTSTTGPSFEDPHNLVHNDLGCVSVSGHTGHMVDLNWSGFDPIFMLHHANIDRLLALWQAIHYDDPVFTTTQPGRALFATPAGDLTANSPLRPFSGATAGAGFHTSRSVESIATFGYTYPELPDWSMSAADLADAVRTAVNTLYGPPPATAATRLRMRKRTTRGPPHVLDTVDFSVELAVDRAEVPLPCTIALLLADEDTERYDRACLLPPQASAETDAKLVSLTSLLAMPQTGLSYATMPLRRALLAEAQRWAINRGRQRSWDACSGGDAAGGPAFFGDGDAVLAHLRQRLRVVITAENGTVVPVASVPSLTVEVQQRSVDAPGTGKAFPRYGPVQRWPLPAKNLQRS